MRPVFHSRISSRAARAVGAVVIATLLMGSDCSWCSGDCCDCNCNCSNCNNCSNCGNNCCSRCCCNNAKIGPNSGVTDLTAYEIHAFELIPSSDARMHPIRALDAIDGLSLPMLIGVQQVSTPAMRLFTQRVLAANQNLLGLPSDAGRLVFSGMRRDGDDFIATYRQVISSFATQDRILSYNALTFRFDAAGELRRIDNRIFVAP